MKPMHVVIAELRQKSAAEHAVEYEERFGRPPRCRNKAWLWHEIARRIQEERHGGLSRVAKDRLEQLIAEIDIPIAERRPEPKPNEPAVGTTLVRSYKGRELRTTRVEGGWEFEGRTHQSLSAVAREATGSSWNGRLFWGLTKRSRDR